MNASAIELRDVFRVHSTPEGDAAALQGLTLAVGERYTTLETKVNFVRAITAETGPVRCEGVVVHRGSRVATLPPHHEVLKEVGTNFP